MADLSFSSRTVLSLVEVNLTTEKSQGSGSTILTMANCSHPAASRMEKLLVGGNGSIRMANLGQRAASMTKKKSTVHGSVTMPMASSGTKAVWNMAKKRELGRFTVSKVNF